MNTELCLLYYILGVPIALEILSIQRGLPLPLPILAGTVRQPLAQGRIKPEITDGKAVSGGAALKRRGV
jgi:hypothetical protein